MSSEMRTCQNCHKKFQIEPEDFKFYEKIDVPSPTWCPECRMIRRKMFRNERALYTRKCNADGHKEDIISVFSSDKKYRIFDYKYWWSDAWDPIKLGKEYDFSKSFLEQFMELFNSSPLLALSNSRAENSDYCNVNDKSKNGYLISAAYETENVAYSNRVAFTKDSLDLYISTKNELCYENVACRDSFKLFFSRDSTNCIDSAFLYNCHNCQNCFGCTNLKNKQYYIFNEPFSKEEYFGKLESLSLANYSNVGKVREKFDELVINSIHKYSHVKNIVNTTGDNVMNTKNCLFCFDVEATEDSKYINWGGYLLKDSFDAGPGIGDNAELFYELFDAVSGSKIFFSGIIYNSHDVSYSYNCHGSNNLFACIGLRNKSYCILNKQYTKEEYEELVPKIIKHMNDMPYIDKKGRVYKYGEFFPPELSPFSYNETIAQEYFPLTKEQALEQGYSWKDPEPRNYTITLKTENIPDHIKDTEDSILNEIIECAHKGKCNEQCTEAFRIIPQELDFLRKQNLPLPRLCPNCRHYQRIKQRNPLKLWRRDCQCTGREGKNEKNPNVYKNTNETHPDHTPEAPCTNIFDTTYAPERPEIIYCETCYLAEVV